MTPKQLVVTRILIITIFIILVRQCSPEVRLERDGRQVLDVFIRLGGVPHGEAQAEALAVGVRCHRVVATSCVPRHAARSGEASGLNISAPTGVLLVGPVRPDPGEILGSV